MSATQGSSRIKSNLVSKAWNTYSGLLIEARRISGELRTLVLRKFHVSSHHFFKFPCASWLNTSTKPFWLIESPIIKLNSFRIFGASEERGRAGHREHHTCFLLLLSQGDLRLHSQTFLSSRPLPFCTRKYTGNKKRFWEQGLHYHLVEYNSTFRNKHSTNDYTWKIFNLSMQKQDKQI